jgi:hypothetical protein
LEAHHDIRADLSYVRNCSIWVRDNYHDVGAIPVPKINGQDILLRGLYLDALLILYRRCFASGQRGALDASRFDEILGPFKELHYEEVMGRANKLTAHAISASASATVKVMNGRAAVSIMRPGHNKYDFENLICLVDRWLPFVDAEIARLTTEFESLLQPGEDEGRDHFVAPWGSRIDIQSLRSGRPAVRTKRQLERKNGDGQTDYDTALTPGESTQD